MARFASQELRLPSTGPGEDAALVWTPARTQLTMRPGQRFMVSEAPVRVCRHFGLRRRRNSYVFVHFYLTFDLFFVDFGVCCPFEEAILGLGGFSGSP